MKSTNQPPQQAPIMPSRDGVQPSLVAPGCSMDPMAKTVPAAGLQGDAVYAPLLNGLDAVRAMTSVHSANVTRAVSSGDSTDSIAEFKRSFTHLSHRLHCLASLSYGQEKWLIATNQLRDAAKAWEKYESMRQQSWVEWSTKLVAASGRPPPTVVIMLPCTRLGMHTYPLTQLHSPPTERAWEGTAAPTPAGRLGAPLTASTEQLVRVAVDARATRICCIYRIVPLALPAPWGLL
ncbi:hypothetical protein HPB50_026368 [Hyalomma asiaticum]|uniref:Uncharacterized protein n=1 Tax=Hyalomma asiaticum TaxID=266040 RepID=A0ACB7TPE1_HYAAI|nr:hypothetical protein HPB50_026368 [Hyalomma asiaticum]